MLIAQTLFPSYATDALLGSKKTVPTVEGEEAVEIGAGTQPNTRITLKVGGSKGEKRALTITLECLLTQVRVGR